MQLLITGCSLVSSFTGLYEGIEDAGAETSVTCDSTTDDSDNCGRCGHVCGPNEYCSRSACMEGCRERTMYVAPQGNDANMGCSKHLQVGMESLAAKTDSRSAF